MTNSGPCSQCGQQNAYNKVMCDFCGARLPWAQVQRPATPPPTPQYRATVSDDAPSFLYALIGFLVPIVGLILWLVEKDKAPLKATSAIKGAGLNILLGFVVSFLFFILIFALGGSRVKNTFGTSANQISLTTSLMR